MDDEFVTSSDSTSEVDSLDVALSEDNSESSGQDVDSNSLHSPAPALAAVGSSPFSSASTGTYYDLASRVVDNSVFPVDYLFLRDGQYSYILYVGDINFNGRVATAHDVSFTRWYRNDSTFDFVETHGTTSININCGNYTCFASASGWPALDVSNSFQTYLLSFFMLVSLCCYVLAKVFNFCMRRSDNASTT